MSRGLENARGVLTYDSYGGPFPILCFTESNILRTKQTNINQCSNFWTRICTKWKLDYCFSSYEFFTRFRNFEMNFY
jgi:hypothetical protein